MRCFYQEIKSDLYIPKIEYKHNIITFLNFDFKYHF